MIQKIHIILLLRLIIGKTKNMINVYKMQRSSKRLIISFRFKEALIRLDLVTAQESCNFATELDNWGIQK